MIFGFWLICIDTCNRDAAEMDVFASPPVSSFEKRAGDAVRLEYGGVSGKPVVLYYPKSGEAKIQCDEAQANGSKFHVRVSQFKYFAGALEFRKPGELNVIPELALRSLHANYGVEVNEITGISTAFSVTTKSELGAFIITAVSPVAGYDYPQIRKQVVARNTDFVFLYSAGENSFAFKQTAAAYSKLAIFFDSERDTDASLPAVLGEWAAHVTAAIAAYRVV